MTLFVLEAINFSKKSVEEINFSGRELTAWMEWNAEKKSRAFGAH